jgi:hypothetical protein
MVKIVKSNINVIAVKMEYVDSENVFVIQVIKEIIVKKKKNVQKIVIIKVPVLMENAFVMLVLQVMTAVLN